MSVSPGLADADQQQSNLNSSSSQHTDDDQSSVASSQDSPLAKRHCSSASMMNMMASSRDLQFLDRCYMQELNNLPHHSNMAYASPAAAAAAMFMATTNALPPAYVDALYMSTPTSAAQAHNMLRAQQQQQHNSDLNHQLRNQYLMHTNNNNDNEDCRSISSDNDCDKNAELFVDVVSTASEESTELNLQLTTPPPAIARTEASPTTSISSARSPSSSPSFAMTSKRSSFSISSILGNSGSRNAPLIA